MSLDHLKADAEKVAAKAKELLMGFDPNAAPTDPNAAAQADPNAAAAANSAPSAEQLAADNEALRAELQRENENLRDQVAASRAAAEATLGLTDEDVRRIEHPEEFAHEASAAPAAATSAPSA